MLISAFREPASKTGIKHLGVLLLGALTLVPLAARAALPAPNANSVLILTSTDGSGDYTAAAVAQGFTVVAASDPQWAALTPADFAGPFRYKAIIIGDPVCGGTPPAVAEANALTVWGPAIDGPKLVIGTDEAFHFGQGGSQLITSGISFVTSAAGQTGAYISLSCYYESSPPSTPVPLLAPFGVFTVESAGCHNDSHIVATSPALTGLTDALLSNWSCSTHEFFNSFPSASFLPLVIAENVPGLGNLRFPDGTNGIPYIVASGGGLAPAVPVPTLSGWMLGLLAFVLAGAAMFSIRRSPGWSGASRD